METPPEPSRSQILSGVATALIVSAITGAITFYGTMEVFGTRLSRAERDIADNKTVIDSSINALANDVKSMGRDISWVRGKLESAAGIK
jgi:hypothetical protein